MNVAYPKSLVLGLGLGFNRIRFALKRAILKHLYLSLFEFYLIDRLFNSIKYGLNTHIQHIKDR